MLLPYFQRTIQETSSQKLTETRISLQIKISGEICSSKTLRFETTQNWGNKANQRSYELAGTKRLGIVFHREWRRFVEPQGSTWSHLYSMWCTVGSGSNFIWKAPRLNIWIVKNLPVWLPKAFGRKSWRSQISSRVICGKGGEKLLV